MTNPFFVTIINPHNLLPTFRPMAQGEEVLTVQSEKGPRTMRVSAVYYFLREDGRSDYAYSMIALDERRRAFAYEDGGRLREFPAKADVTSRMSFNPIDNAAHQLRDHKRLSRFFWRQLDR